MLAYAKDEEAENNNKTREAFGGDFNKWKSSYTWDKGEDLAPKYYILEDVIEDSYTAGSRMVLY